MEELGQKLSIIDNFSQPLINFANKMTTSAQKMAEMSNIGQRLTTNIDSMDQRIHSTSDTWQMFSDKLSALKIPTEQINAAKSELSSLAEQSSLSVDKLADSYAEMASRGVSHTSELVRALERLSSSTDNPANSMDNLTNIVANGMNRDKVQVEDFNSILRSTPQLAERIASSMNTTVSDLIEDFNRGKVSAEEFANALRRASNSGGGGRRPPIGGNEESSSSGRSGGFGTSAIGGLFGHGHMFGSMLGANLIASGVVGAIGATKNGLASLKEEMDTSSKAWQTFQGNMEEIHMPQAQINKTRQALTDYAQATIYDSSDMASTYSQFAAVGTKNAQQVVTGFGGIAAAAQDPVQAMKTLSQQGTQMAAKPKVQWQDFRLMLDQTPAGIAAVAKTMHESTGQLIRDVEGGKVKTEDFLNAVAKTGNNAKFTQMATHYKTVGEAIDGTRETLANKLEPEWKNVSDVVIGAINRINDGIGSMNVKGLGNKIKPILNIGINGTFDFFKTAAADVKAFFGAFKDTGALSNFSKIVDNIKTAIDKVFSNPNSKKQNPLAVFENIGTIAGTVVNGATKLTQAIAKLDPGTIKELAVAIFLLNVSAKGLALSGLVSGLLLLAKVPADQLKKVGIAITIVAGALAVLKTAKSIIDVFDSVSGWLGKFSKSTSSLSSASEGLGKTTTNFIALGAGMLLLGAGILVAAYGVSIFADAAIKLVNAGWPAIGMFVAFIAIIAVVAIAVSTFGEVLLVGSAGLVVFGAGLALVGLSIFLVGAGLDLVLGQLPNLATYGFAGAGAMMALAGALAVMSVAMVVGAVGLVALGAGAIVAAAGALAVGAGLAILGAGALVAGAGLTVVGASLYVVAGGINAMKQALTGHLSSAKSEIDGIKGSVSGLGSAVSSATGKIFGGVRTHADSTQDHVNGLKMTPQVNTDDATKKLDNLNQKKISPKMDLSSFNKTDLSKLNFGDLSKLSGSKMGKISAPKVGQPVVPKPKMPKSLGKISAPKVAQPTVPKPKMPKQIGKIPAPKVGNPNMSGVVATVKKGMQSATNVIRSSRSSFYSAGSYIVQGLVSGMQSELSQVSATANQLVSEADKAARAKARIHSPSRLFAEIGSYLGQGMAVGMNDSTNYISDASDSMQDAAESGIGDINGGKIYRSNATGEDSTMDSYRSDNSTNNNTTSNDHSIHIARGAIQISTNNSGDLDEDTIVGMLEHRLMNLQKGSLANG